VTFVDSNVFMYAVGRSHPLRDEAREVFLASFRGDGPALVTSVAVLQELLHAYVPVRRMVTLDAALALVDSCVQTIWPIEPEDARHARALADVHPGLGARDLLHLACCQRRGVASVKTYDAALAAAFRG